MKALSLTSRNQEITVGVLSTEVCFNIVQVNKALRVHNVKKKNSQGRVTGEEMHSLPNEPSEYPQDHLFPRF